MVLEDEASIRSFIVINLRRAGYEVVEAETGEEALDKLHANPDTLVALLDVMLPGIDGFEVCRRIRATNPRIGIIMLTARSQEMDKVTGLMTGADDYVTKPFSMKVLLAKLAVLLGRNDAQAAVLDDGWLRIDLALAQITRAGEAVRLSPTEWKLLRLFLDHRGQLLTYAVILDALWAEGVELSDKHALAVAVNRLRKKLETEAHSYIANVYGMGYLWK